MNQLDDYLRRSWLERYRRVRSIRKLAESLVNAPSGVRAGYRCNAAFDAAIKKVMSSMIHLRGHTLELVAAAVAWRNAESRARLSGFEQRSYAQLTPGQLPRALVRRDGTFAHLDMSLSRSAATGDLGSAEAIDVLLQAGNDLDFLSQCIPLRNAVGLPKSQTLGATGDASVLGRTSASSASLPRLPGKAPLARGRTPGPKAGRRSGDALKSKGSVELKHRSVVSKERPKKPLDPAVRAWRAAASASSDTMRCNPLMAPRPLTQSLAYACQQAGSRAGEAEAEGREAGGGHGGRRARAQARSGTAAGFEPSYYLEEQEDGDGGDGGNPGDGSVRGGSKGGAGAGSVTSGSKDGSLSVERGELAADGRVLLAAGSESDRAMSSRGTRGPPGSAHGRGKEAKPAEGLGGVTPPGGQKPQGSRGESPGYSSDEASDFDGYGSGTDGGGAGAGGAGADGPPSAALSMPLPLAEVLLLLTSHSNELKDAGIALARLLSSTGHLHVTAHPLVAAASEAAAVGLEASAQVDDVQRAWATLPPRLVAAHRAGRKLLRRERRQIDEVLGMEAQCEEVGAQARAAYDRVFDMAGQPGQVDRGLAAQVVLVHHVGCLVSARAEGAPLCDEDLAALEPYVAALRGSGVGAVSSAAGRAASGSPGRAAGPESKAAVDPEQLSLDPANLPVQAPLVPRMLEQFLEEADPTGLRLAATVDVELGSPMAGGYPGGGERDGVKSSSASRRDLKPPRRPIASQPKAGGARGGQRSVVSGRSRGTAPAGASRGSSHEESKARDSVATSRAGSMIREGSSGSIGNVPRGSRGAGLATSGPGSPPGARLGVVASTYGAGVRDLRRMLAGEQERKRVMIARQGWYRRGGHRRGEKHPASGEIGVAGEGPASPDAAGSSGVSNAGSSGPAVAAVAFPGRNHGPKKPDTKANSKSRAGSKAQSRVSRGTRAKASPGKSPTRGQKAGMKTTASQRKAGKSPASIRTAKGQTKARNTHKGKSAKAPKGRRSQAAAAPARGSVRSKGRAASKSGGKPARYSAPVHVHVPLVQPPSMHSLQGGTIMPPVREVAETPESPGPDIGAGLAMSSGVLTGTTGVHQDGAGEQRGQGDVVASGTAAASTGTSVANPGTHSVGKAGSGEHFGRTEGRGDGIDNYDDDQDDGYSDDDGEDDDDDDDEYGDDFEEKEREEATSGSKHGPGSLPVGTSAAVNLDPATTASAGASTGASAGSSAGSAGPPLAQVEVSPASYSGQPMIAGAMSPGEDSYSDEEERGEGYDGREGASGPMGGRVGPAGHGDGKESESGEDSYSEDEQEAGSAAAQRTVPAVSSYPAAANGGMDVALSDSDDEYSDDE